MALSISKHFADTAGYMLIFLSDIGHLLLLTAVIVWTCAQILTSTGQ